MNFKCPHGYTKCKWHCDEKCLETTKIDFVLVRIFHRFCEILDETFEKFHKVKIGGNKNGVQ